MNTKTRSSQTIKIVGAGPAGLAAAITLAHAGKAVIIHEMHAEVGSRFMGDLQGLDNWSTTEDVLSELEKLGLTTAFSKLPCYDGTAFDAWERAYKIHSREPLFYMVERGPGPQTLDQAFLTQAIDAGVQVRFRSRQQNVLGPGILATGPKAADAIAVGYHFNTTMMNGFWVICDDNLAPGGYAYLLIMNGRGTVKSCMFRDFRQEALYVRRTVSAFERLVSLKMDNPKPHGGAANFQIPFSARSGRHAVVGEQAGFQDGLWGFGMRVAVLSGVHAARCLLEGHDYDTCWRNAFKDWLSASLVNRMAYSILGNRGYRWALRRQELNGNARALLQGVYRPTLAKRALLPLALWHMRRRRKDETCNHIDCSCVWCRCQQA